MASAGSTPALAPAARVVYEGSPSWKNEFGRTLLEIVTIPLVVGLVFLIVDWVRRANTHYRITDKRVEWETGAFGRRIDGVDLWRIRHVNYVQTFWDRIFGLSRLEMFSQDGEDPHLVIVGMPASRVVYDAVTASTQQARQGTVGIVQ